MLIGQDFFLAKAGYIDASTRGVWSLTEKGRNITLTHRQAFELFDNIHKQFSQERKKKPEKEQTQAEDLDDSELIEE